MRTTMLMVSLLALVGCSSSASEPTERRDRDASAQADVATMADMDVSVAPDGGSDAADSSPDLAPDLAADMMTVDPISFAEYCDGLGVRYLNWLAQCYGSQNYDAADPREQARFAKGCHQAADAVAAGRTSFDGSQAVSCLQALAASNCDRFTFFDGVPECEGVTAPLQPNGEVCYATSGRHFAVAGECASGSCASNACPGTCIPYLEIGARCDGDNGGVCDPESATCNFILGECVAQPQLNESCDGLACPEGLQCDFQDTLTCREFVPFSEACADDDLCENGTFCSAGFCVSKVGLGEPCEVRIHCADGQQCLDPDGMGPQDTVCAMPGGAGAVCTEERQCLPGHGCDGATCYARPIDGAACDFDQCGVGHWCRHQAVGDTGTCEALGNIGETCAHGYGSAFPSDGCADGACVDGTCRAPGVDGEPCDPGFSSTCENGFFCARAARVCTPLGASGEPCNPAWQQTCATGLGCACAQDDASCDVYEIAANPGDSCEPLLSNGATCWRSTECASLNCFDDDGNGTRTCQPGECLP